MKNAEKLTSDFLRKKLYENFSAFSSFHLTHSFFRIWCNKRIEIKRVCRLQMKKKLFMSMKKNSYLRSSANFLFFFYFLLKFDITFTAHGIKRGGGRESSYHERKIFCTMHPLRNKKILFYFIYLWHLHMVKLFAIFLIHFYNAFLSSSFLQELLIRYMQYDLMPKVERAFWI